MMHIFNLMVMIRQSTNNQGNSNKDTKIMDSKYFVQINRFFLIFPNVYWGSDLLYTEKWSSELLPMGCSRSQRTPPNETATWWAQTTYHSWCKNLFSSFKHWVTDYTLEGQNNFKRINYMCQVINVYDNSHHTLPPVMGTWAPIP